ncbi:HAD-IIB family hydrolase [Kineococcus sp. R8]|uniref:HAD-IIB family hydrolase n=1 Tax=Kineococcus siccus TaxID=2696567 RepID=UPI00141219B0|nr:HAD-IIB family hydrolase [Kineococcus siccus]
MTPEPAASTLDEGSAATRDADERAFAAGWRLVATDLDGTVIPRDRPLSARTLAAFAACAEVGISIVPVTGRPPRWVTPLAEEAGLRGQVVCANGAVVFDLDRGEVVRQHEIPRATVREVADLLRPVLPGIGFALEALAGFRREPAYATRFDAGLEARVAELDDLLVDSPPVVKILAKCPGTPSDEMVRVAVGAVGHLVNVTHSNAVDSLIEIGRLGVSKATTLAEVAADRGVGREGVVAFGDMPNDLEMLRWAGRSYAMGDGHADAREAADDVAAACGEDGVAQVLERLLSWRGR